MRRAGKLRYMCRKGFFAGAIMTAAMVAVGWMKAGTIGITIEAIVAIMIAGLFGMASARNEWNRFESIYPDIGIYHDSAVR